MLYRKVLLPLISRLSPQNASTLVYKTLGIMNRFFLTRWLLRLIYFRSFTSLKKEVFGITFPNPIGLGAGIDRNAEFCDIVDGVGFGFVEIGPVTPRPDRGRFTDNKGIIAAINNLKTVHSKAIIAADIACNSSATEEDIGPQLEKSVALLYDFADLFVINASIRDGANRSPMEDPDILEEVMDGVLDMRMTMTGIKPVLIRLLPDIPKNQLDPILDYSMRSGVDGIVVGDINGRHGGRFEKDMEFVRYVHSYTKGRLEIIGRGGITKPEEAYEIMQAGASLIELYTGIFLEGPRFVRKTLKFLEEKNAQKS